MPLNQTACGIFAVFFIVGWAGIEEGATVMQPVFLLLLLMAICPIFLIGPDTYSQSCSSLQKLGIQYANSEKIVKQASQFFYH